MTDYVLSAKGTYDGSHFNRGVKGSQGALDAFAKKCDSISQKFDKISDAFTSIGTVFTPVSAAFGAVGAKAASTAVDFNKLYESTMVVFEKMLGGKDAAQALYGSLLDVAKASTFSQETFLRSGKSLVGVGVSAKKTQQYMQMASDAVSAFGGTSEDVERVAYAMRKVATSGKLQGEELMMLQDAGVNALQILTNKYNEYNHTALETADVQEKLSKGEIDGRKALDWLTEGVENGTDGIAGMTKALKGMSKSMKGKTLTGAFDSLNTSIRSFSLSLIGLNPTLKSTDAGYEQNQRNIANLTASISTINEIIPMTAKLFTGVTDAIAALLVKLVGANAKFDEAKGKWVNVSGALGTLREKLNSLDPEKARAIGNVIAAMAAAGVGLPALGLALGKIGSIVGLFANPFGAALLAVTALAAGFNLLYDKSRAFRDFFAGAVGAIKQFASQAKFTKLMVEQGMITPFEGLQRVLGELQTAVSKVVSSMYANFSERFPAIAGVIDPVIEIVGKVVGRFGIMANGVIASFVGLYKGTLTPVEALKGVFNSLVHFVSTSASSLAQFASTSASAIYESFASKFPALAHVIELVVEWLTSLRDKASEALSGISPAAVGFAATFGGALALMAPKIGGVVSAVSAITAAFGKALPVVGQFLAKFALVNALSGPVGILKAIPGVIGAIVSPVGLVVAGIALLVGAFATLMATNDEFRATVVSLVGIIAANLYPIIMTIGQAITQLVSSVLPSLMNIFSMLMPVLGQIIVVILEVAAALAPIITTIVSTLVPIITTVIQLVVQAAETVLSAVLPAISSILSAIQVAMPSIMAVVSAAMTAILAVVQFVWPTMQSIIDTAMAAIQTVVNVVMAIIKGDWEGAWNALMNGLKSILSGLEGIVRSGFDGAISFITGLADMAFGWGADIVQGIIDGINSLIGGIADAASGIADQIASFLHFSEPDVGPLSNFHTFMPDMMDLMAKGINGNLGTVRNAVARVASVVEDGINTDFGAEFAYAGSVSYETTANRQRRAEIVTNYYTVGDVTFEVSDFEDMNTAYDVIDILTKSVRGR